jgi:circadian clock protein KaiC
MAQHGLIGQNGAVSPVDASYLADTVLMTRYFETAGMVRQALSVIKKRTGRHERTIRELRLETGKGIHVGEPLHEFDGVLSGTPHYVGDAIRGRSPDESKPRADG